MFPTCVPAPGWTVSPLRWTASAALWPKRWIHSYSGTTELASRWREGPSGSLSVHLGVKKEKQGEEERCGKQEHGKKKKTGWSYKWNSKEPSLLFPPLLSIAFIFWPNSSPRTAAFIQQKPRKCYLGHHAHWSLWHVTVGQTVVFWHKFWWDSEQFGLLKKINWVAINKAGGCQVRGS